MPGYRYEILLHADAGERRATYWSAYRLLPGSKVVVGADQFVVLETRLSAAGDVDFVAVCRPARQEERLD